MSSKIFMIERKNIASGQQMIQKEGKCIRLSLSNKVTNGCSRLQLSASTSFRPLDQRCWKAENQGHAVRPADTVITRNYNVPVEIL